MVATSGCNEHEQDGQTDQTHDRQRHILATEHLTPRISFTIPNRFGAERFRPLGNTAVENPRIAWRLPHPRRPQPRVAAGSAGFLLADQFAVAPCEAVDFGRAAVDAGGVAWPGCQSIRRPASSREAAGCRWSSGGHQRHNDCRCGIVVERMSLQ
jgi:hypothetical protein